MADPPTVASLTADMAELKANLDMFFLIVMGMIVFLMQCGFAFLEAGSVRSKNTSNILIKNLLDSFVAGIAYWTFGYAFAYGDGSGDAHKFIGRTKWSTNKGQIESDAELASFFFQFVFAATAATIVSGALAERCEFFAYFVYSFFITAFIYPVVSHWGWHSEGWLQKGRDYDIDNRTITINYKDFAGSGIVHVVGGVAALVGCIILGPRIGRFHSDTKLNLRGHSVPFAALGGFILLFGFMAFNGGSQLTISNPGDGAVVSLAVVNTVISGSMAAFVSLVIHRIVGRRWSLLSTLNGALAGMVAICAGCNVIRPWGAVIVGTVGGFIFNAVSYLMVKFKFDDPLDAVAVHFGGGFWGVISVALLEYKRGIIMAWDKQSGYQLGWQLAGLAAIIGWTAFLCFVMFGLLRIFRIFRVSPDVERKGLDIPKHGEPAYPVEAYGHGYVEEITSLADNGQPHTNGGGIINRAMVRDDGYYETPETRAMGDLRNRSATVPPHLAAQPPQGAYPGHIYSPEMAMVVNARNGQPQSAPTAQSLEANGSSNPGNVAVAYTEKTAL